MPTEHRNAYSNLRFGWILATLAAGCWLAPTESLAQDSTRVLIVVGPSDHPPGTHEVGAGARLIEHCLRSATATADFEVTIVEGWPENKQLLQGLGAIVFTGDRFPLAELPNPEVTLAELEELIDGGCGILCYHYATGLTAGQVSSDGDHPLLRWTGGYFATRCEHHQSIARIFDRAYVEIRAAEHPVMRGVQPFAIYDEPYIKNYFGPHGLAANVVALASAQLPPENPQDEVIAWAVERPNGGRGMAIVLPHFYRNWKVDDLRKMILNGIAWVSHAPIPERGIEVTLPDLETFSPEAVEPAKGFTLPGRKSLPRRLADDTFAENGLSASVTVFRARHDGYNVFRIPALIRAANGDLLAFCEARQGGDASQIDLVMKRSSDHGASWGPLHVVLSHRLFSDLYPAGTPISVGNPAPVVDWLDPQHAGRIHLPFTVENDRVFVTHSDDHGTTWSSPREISGTVKREGWGWYATGPSHGIQLMNGPWKGRLLIPADHRLGNPGEDRGAEGAHVLISDDHGLSWRLGAVDDSYDDELKANETTAVELVDGRVLFNTRDQHGAAVGTRGQATSSDGGETFDAVDGPYSPFVPIPELTTPVVQCAMLRGWSTLESDPFNVVLFSGPDERGPSGAGRSDLRIRFSTDEGGSWVEGPLLHVGPAAYSDMARVADNAVAILFECGSSGGNAYERIDCIRLRLDDFTSTARSKH
jgi:sialidase-1